MVGTHTQGIRNVRINAGFDTNCKGSYSYVPNPPKKTARFEGDKARCGGCNSMLGEFKSVDGEIKCKKNDCKVINIVKK